MNTVPATRKPRNIKPAHGSVRLTVTINGIGYSARPLPVDPGSGVTRCIRLRKSDATTYHVHRDEDGLAGCDCPDFEFNRRQIDPTGCKHCKALAAVGLI
jgi:hypothetical protein